MASGQEDSPLLEQMVIKIVKIPAVEIKVVEVKPGTPEWALDIIKYIATNNLTTNGKLERSRTA